MASPFSHRAIYLPECLHAQIWFVTAEERGMGEYELDTEEGVCVTICD